MTRESIEVTRQDRIYCLKASSDYHSELCEECRFYPKCDHMTQDDMTELTIKDLETLEQEPCNDAISRQAAIDCLNADFTIDGKENMETVVDYINGAFKQIKALPSVTPKPKMGQWIMKHRTHNEVNHYTGQDEMGETHTISVLERYEVDEPYCSKCGKLAGDTSQNFCCACGAKMVEPQERSDKE